MCRCALCAGYCCCIPTILAHTHTHKAHTQFIAYVARARAEAGGGQGSSTSSERCCRAVVVDAVAVAAAARRRCRRVIAGHA